jgi:hypothetical protein
MTKEEFENRYATCSGLSVEELSKLELFAAFCDCGEEGCPGWQMISQQLKS